MAGLAEELQGEHDDNLGATAARDAAEKLGRAAEELREAAEYVRSLAQADNSVLLIGLQRRLTAATVAAEEGRHAAELVHVRQLSAATMREAHRRTDYQAGWDACLAWRRGLRAV
jgi:hypothetical protein